MTSTEPITIEVAAQERTRAERHSWAMSNKSAPSSFEPGVDPAILAVEDAMAFDELNERPDAGPVAGFMH